MKQYIIDAHNVIYKSNLLRLQLDRSIDIARNSLLQMIEKYSKNYPAFSFIVIFDGKIGYNSLNNPNLKVLSSGQKEADELIKNKISKLKSSSNIIVVSSDNAVASFAKVHSCETLTSASFINLINSEPKKKFILGKNQKNINNEKPTSTSKKEIEEFKKIFGEN